MTDKEALQAVARGEKLPQPIVIRLLARTCDQFSFLKDISASATEFQAFIEAKNHGTNDFTCFKDKPIFHDRDFFFVTDAAFLVEKAEAGTFWRINNALLRKSRLQFHQDWGSLSSGTSIG